MKSPVLYIFSGLPASGKSTLAMALAKKLNIAYFRIDTLEQGLRDICNMQNIEGEGYRLSYRVVKDNLDLGNNVIADSVNPWKLTRDEWNNVAAESGAKYVNIEVICSDKEEHKSRVESRSVSIKNLKLPSWEEIIKRDYHSWDTPRIQIDTSEKTIDGCVEELLRSIEQRAR